MYTLKFSRTPTKTFEVTVTTGKAEKSGTNATVRIALVDESGKISEKHSLNRLFYNDFEYGRVDTYEVTTDIEFGKWFLVIFFVNKNLKSLTKKPTEG